jgi:predicted transcriptional regulator
MKQEIILLSVREGKSQREISKLTGVHRKTVKKYLEEYEACLKNLEEDPSSSSRSNLIDTLVKPPTYCLGKRVKRKLSDQIIAIVKHHLHDNEMKSSIR